MTPFDNPKVAAAYDALPKDACTGALILRDLILETAASLPADWFQSRKQMNKSRTSRSLIVTPHCLA